MKSEKKVKLWKALIFAVIFVMLALISVGIGIASATTIYVPNDYAKIQWTVDNASAGDTINVMGGTNENEENASLHLYEQMDKYKSGTKLRLIESYVGTVTHPTTYTAWVYDNDLAILALADQGTAEDKERAEILCDALVWCQNHDQDFSDGRVRDGYWATDIKDPSGKNSSIKSPGSGTGNMAWTIIALLRCYEVSNNETYLNASKRLGNWIFKECYNDSGAGGYTGGYEDKNFDWELEKITWKSTEHNIDAYVAFMRLYNVTGNTTWLDRAIHANKFVKAMWNESEGHFWTGTLNDGVTINEGLLPEDVNTWGLMALGNPNKYGGGIQWVEDNCLVDPCPRGCGCDGRRFKGFDCDDDKDGIWFEGTAHMCIAYLIMNETDNSSKYISELRRAQTCANNSNGKGIVAACHDGVTCCHWEFPNALHIGATSWYIFAERKLNPFWGINTSDQIPIIWYVDDDGGADFTSIQDAVDTANDGDIIIVNSGTYYENVNVTKQLILMGVDTGSSKPVIDAGGNGSAITLSADGITLDGFTATNSSGSGINAGIKVTSNNNIITGNDASDNDYGIYLWSSNNNTISGNTASNNRLRGICLRSSSSNNTISGNTASNNDRSGIDLFAHSNTNIITGNTFVNDGLSVWISSTRNIVEENIVNGKPLVYLKDVSDYKVEDAGQVILVNCNNITVENLDLSNTSVGVELWQTEDSLISNNTASNNKCGIHLRYSSNNTLKGNTVSNNIKGICLGSSSNNDITGNTASNNDISGIYLYLSSSSNNIITGNTFVNDGLSYQSAYQNTVEENIVNGKPLVYLEDAVDYKVEEAGQVILVNCSNITIENLDLSNTCVGVALFKTGNSIILNNTVSNNNIHGIDLSDSSNNTITGNTANNNRDGIFLRYSSNNIITGNTVSNNAEGILLVNSNNNTIYCNNVSDNREEGFNLLYSNNNTITGNTASNNTRDGIQLGDSSNNILSNNTANSNSWDGICLSRSSNNTLSNNIALSNNIDGISLSQSRNNNNTLSNNTANSNNYCGIYFSGSNNILSNNIASNNFHGILLYSSSNNSLSNNNVNSNDQYGIHLSSSSNNILSNNNVSNNLYGLYLSGSNNILSNNIALNNDRGIYLEYSCNNILFNNTASNNAYGIYIYSSNNTITGNNASNNKIYLNNFINNADNVYSEGSNNIWNSTEDITYTYGGSTCTNYLGNYWSDYKEMYPNAKEIYGCGIWDTPYSISFDHDFHPLIQPWENYFAPAASIFDTGTGTYPSIKGTHEGTITPSRSINVSKLYTYPCAGTGGHTESIKLEENGTVIANGTWDGYHEDWHNITLYNVTDGTHYVTLLQDHEYNYTIRTGSYPQILHAASKEVTGGTITCTSFVDANGKRYRNRIPAIRLE